MKNVLFILCILTLTGCMENGYQETSFPKLPTDLKDCKFFALYNSNGTFLNVVRCPNSQTSTTYQTGKATQSVIVIDGVTYQMRK